MPRLARCVFAGLPHHVVQRGNRREDVFFSDADRSTYLDWLGQYCAEHGAHVLAYCLMTNHVHLVIVPPVADGLARIMRPLHTRYAMRVNRRRGLSGHLWQGRYFSSVLDESYLWTAIRYVERNPVRARLVGRAETYRWSSARAHCQGHPDALLTRDPRWVTTLGAISDWPAWLADDEPLARLVDVRRRLEQSVPCGTSEFVQRLEREAGQVLIAKPRGRPRREGEKGVRPLFCS